MYQIQQASIRYDCPIGEDVSIGDVERDRSVRKFDQNQEGLQTRKICQPVSSLYHEDPLSTVQHDSLYTSVKVQCDRILNLLGLHEPRRTKEKKCSGSEHSTEKVSSMLEERECQVRHQEAKKESSVLSRTAVKDQGESCVVEEENGDHLETKEWSSVEEEPSNPPRNRAMNVTPFNPVADGNMEATLDQNVDAVSEQYVDEGNGEMSEISHEKEHGNGEWSETNDMDEAGCYIDDGVAFDVLAYSVTGGYQDDDQDMDGIGFLTEEDCIDREQSSQVDGEEFWWDNEDWDEEVGIQTVTHTRESFSSQVSAEGHRSEQEVLLHEWYESEEILGMDNEATSTAEDGTGLEEKETLLAEWSLIEEAMELEMLLNRPTGIDNQNFSKDMHDKISEIIGSAKLKLHGVVVNAFRDICEVQEESIYFPKDKGILCDKLCGISRTLSGEDSDIIEEQFVGVIRTSSDEDSNYQGACDPGHMHAVNKPLKHHNKIKNTSRCIESGVLVVYSDGLRGEPIFSEQNKVGETTFLEDLEYHSAHLEDTLLGSQHLFKEDSHYAGLPNRWHLHGIQDKTVDWMPDDSAQDGAQQRGVAWKRRRRKFRNLMHVIRDNACTWVE